MAIPFGAKRASAQLLIRSAAKQNLSAAETIRRLKDKGLSYRRTDMLADFRSAGNVESKTGLLRYVRKDYVPSGRVLAEVSWKLSREYMYKVQMEVRESPGAQPIVRHINLMSDRPMTPREIETEIESTWGTWYPEKRDEIVGITPITAVRRIE